MLMIWSSRARNRSFDPVVWCFFGRIVPSDADKESCFPLRGNPKTKLQGSDTQSVKTLQSQNGLPNCNSRLTVQPFFTDDSVKYIVALVGEVGTKRREGAFLSAYAPK